MGQKKLKIAITGSIGSGKSLFAEFMKEKGYNIIIADDVSKEILANDSEVKKQIKKNFGESSFTGDQINSKYLAEKVFSNPDNVLIINSILHPLVIKKIEKMMDEELRLKDKIFVEAALIYEADMEEMFDYVILITANKENRAGRKAGKLSLEEFEKRDNNQIPEIEKKKRADFIFDNNGSIEDLAAKASLLLSII